MSNEIMRTRLRIILPSVMGIVSLPLVLWDIHNQRVIESMGMGWDTGAPIWPYQTSDIMFASMEGLWLDWERTVVESKLGTAIVGSSAKVKAGLEKLVGDTAANEVIVVTDTYEHADRIESYRRVAGVAAMIDVKSIVPA